MTLGQKLDRLKQILLDMESVLVAFSGGVDSTFLAKVAVNTLPPAKVLAVTMVSAFLPLSEKQEAARLAKAIAVRHQFAKQKLVRALRHNPKDRCYHCKKEVFSCLLRLARQKSFSVVVDGSNTDDLSDYRPGTKAVRELKVRSPLQEAGLTKKDIRLLSKRWGLDTWDKPAMACLGSRFAYGETFTKKKLTMVEEAEDFLHSLGLRQVRVRHHPDLCRIETATADLPLVLRYRDKIVRKIKALGYAYVTVDLEGYRRGAMNEVIQWKREK